MSSTEELTIGQGIVPFPEKIIDLTKADSATVTPDRIIDLNALPGDQRFSTTSDNLSRLAVGVELGTIGIQDEWDQLLDQQSRMAELQARREAVMHNLLIPSDFLFAERTGLMNQFYIDPVTGEDGLLHMLSGSEATGPDGSIVYGGYHLESASQDSNLTRVNTNHPEVNSRKHRNRFVRFPFEPYQAHTIIGGYEKSTLHLDLNTGEYSVVPSKSQMFPEQYDALAVIRSVIQARDNRNRFNDKIVPGTMNPNTYSIVNDEATTIMLDGKTPMKIRLILDASTQKIISAYPLANRVSEMMKLTPEEVQRHLYG